MEAETIVILQTLRYCKRNDLHSIIVETDSLKITKMIRHEWRILWSQAEKIQEIQELLPHVQANIQHVFREANQLADRLANEACDQNGKIQAQAYQQLSGACREILNTNKAQISSLRIRTRKISIHVQQHE
ncbi:hypothetical protein R3W88_029809 [Solanum pinnatisectum]|uniref:RNase H type-1 domain-containing protein n=1 Tax=Solanum pinnatisectum TaxID=50273 RepID=A0AAV9K6C8_9SOLN|nr:hypothetical protein R3W88_029809 [Solanum pinnatisectum]